MTLDKPFNKAYFQLILADVNIKAFMHVDKLGIDSLMNDKSFNEFMAYILPEMGEALDDYYIN
tara:strand:- start:5 stop:193 length:189 start_codon:yes stop_codon:yes gene_type:complete